MTATDPALADCRLMVATPIYDGAQGTYVRSVLDFALTAQVQGLSVRFEFNLYQPSITRSRSMLTAMFLASDCTHMLFVDSDIEFSPTDALSMVRAMRERPECAILGAPCPRRQINWRTLARAVELGMAKQDPADLARFAGDFALKFLDPGQRFALTDIVELERVGTGMMLIRRDVLEKLRDDHPELAFKPDPAERQTYRLGETVPAVFYPMIEPGTQALLSDDYAFCRRVRDAGFRIWLAPWVKTSHSGPAVFHGSLADLAQLSAAASVPSPE